MAVTGRIVADAARPAAVDTGRYRWANDAYGVRKDLLTKQCGAAEGAAFAEGTNGLVRRTPAVNLEGIVRRLIAELTIRILVSRALPVSRAGAGSQVALAVAGADGYAYSRGLAFPVHARGVCGTGLIAAAAVVVIVIRVDADISARDLVAGATALTRTIDTVAVLAARLAASATMQGVVLRVDTLPIALDRAALALLLAFLSCAAVRRIQETRETPSQRRDQQPAAIGIGEMAEGSNEAVSVHSELLS